MITFERRIDTKDAIAPDCTLNIVKKDCHNRYVSAKELSQEIFIEKDFVNSIFTRRFHRTDNLRGMDKLGFRGQYNFVAREHEIQLIRHLIAWIVWNGNVNGSWLTF